MEPHSELIRIVVRGSGDFVVLTHTALAQHNSVCTIGLQLATTSAQFPIFLFLPPAGRVSPALSSTMALSGFGLAFLENLRDLTTPDRRSIVTLKDLAFENLGEAADVMRAIRMHVKQVSFGACVKGMNAAFQAMSSGLSTSLASAGPGLPPHL